MTETLVVIDAPNFCAGLVARDGRVIEAAPILRYMKGWTGRRVADYCMAKGWRWKTVQPD
jgi:hypothetical protein